MRRSRINRSTRLHRIASASFLVAVASFTGCLHDWTAVTAVADVTTVADVADAASSDVVCTACGNDCVALDRDPGNCGACGNACAAPDNAIATCVDSVCAYDCAPGFDRCGDRCIATENNVSYCGASCFDCVALPHVNSDTVNCTHGACGVINACEPGWADCDGNAMTGCETDLTTASSCGGCRTQCAGSTPRCAGDISDGFACAP